MCGAYHALLFVPLLLLGKNRRYRDTVATITLPDGTIKTKWLPSIKEIGQMLLTFIMAVFGWIIFRANNISDLRLCISKLLSYDILTKPDIISPTYFLPIPIVVFFMLFCEWSNRSGRHGLDFEKWKPWQRWIMYILILGLMLSFKTQTESFIYFQF